LAGESGVDLMNRAFGPTGPLMKGAADKKERAATRDLFAGAFSIFRNPSAHQEVKFDEPREVRRYDLLRQSAIADDRQDLTLEPLIKRQSLSL